MFDILPNSAVQQGVDVLGTHNQGSVQQIFGVRNYHCVLQNKIEVEQCLCEKIYFFPHQNTLSCLKGTPGGGLVLLPSLGL